MESLIQKIFISYSWSSPEHEKFVIELAEDLVESGVDVVIDKWDLQNGQDSLSFMESMINDDSIRKVLIISDKVYAEKANNRAGGVGTETQIISPEIYASATQTKFVMVTTQKDEEGRHHVPIFYKGRIFIDMTDASLYSDGLEKILRWVYDKPVYKKPELGKRPLFLDESPETSLGTSSYCMRAVDAIRGGKSTVLGFFDEYLSTLTTNLERIRFKVGNSLEPDVEFINNIDSFIPVRNEFVNLISLVARFNLGVDFSKRIHAFFQEAVSYCYVPESFNSYNEMDFDNFKFLINELYLYTIALYLKHERFDECSILFDKYYVPIKSKFGDNPLNSYTIMNQHVSMLEWRNRHRNLRRLSLHADLLKERCHGLPVNFPEVNQADFLCYIKAMNEKDEQYNFWWPNTLLYSRGRHPFEIFSKASDRGYFIRLKGLIGFSSGAELLEFVQALEKSDRLPRWEFDRISPLRLSNAEVIAANN